MTQKIIVTAGASGIGAGIVEKFLSEGALVHIADVDKSALETLAQRPGLTSSLCDVSNEQNVIDLFDAAVDGMGGLTGLVNCAGIAGPTAAVEHIELAAWQACLGVNLDGAFLCCKQAVPHLKKAGAGSIINISSDLGLIAPDQRLYSKDGVDNGKQNVKPVTYSVVKTGLIGLTRYLATYWADKNVRCNAMCPGGVENGQPEEFLKEVSARIPMGRMANASEYQGALLWMLSDASSYLNGAIIPIEGGRTVW